MSDYHHSNLSLASISRMVRARREWWAKRKQLSRAGNGQHRDMHSDSRDVGKERRAGSLSRAVEVRNVDASMFGEASADAARPASLSPASHRASAPRAGTNRAACACGG